MKSVRKSARAAHNAGRIVASRENSSPRRSSDPQPQLAQRDTVWLSVRRAAERAGNSPRTIKRWIKAGYLSANRLPSPKGKGPLRVRLGDLESLIGRGAIA